MDRGFKAIFRSVLRLCRQFDRNPQLKAVILRQDTECISRWGLDQAVLPGGREFYLPTARGFAELAKKCFRQESLEPSINSQGLKLSLDASFDVIKALNSALQRARRLGVLGPLESPRRAGASHPDSNRPPSGECRISGQPRPGTFLVAHPMMPSSNFHKSLIFVVDYSPKTGAFGVVVNSWHIDASLPPYGRLIPSSGSEAGGHSTAGTAGPSPSSPPQRHHGAAPEAAGESARGGARESVHSNEQDTYGGGYQVRAPPELPSIRRSPRMGVFADPVWSRLSAHCQSWQAQGSATMGPQLVAGTSSGQYQHGTRMAAAREAREVRIGGGAAGNSGDRAAPRMGRTRRSDGNSAEASDYSRRSSEVDLQSSSTVLSSQARRAPSSSASTGFRLQPMAVLRETDPARSVSLPALPPDGPARASSSQLSSSDAESDLVTGTGTGTGSGTGALLQELSGMPVPPMQVGEAGTPMWGYSSGASAPRRTEPYAFGESSSSSDGSAKPSAVEQAGYQPQSRATEDPRHRTVHVPSDSLLAQFIRAAYRTVEVDVSADWTPDPDMVPEASSDGSIDDIEPWMLEGQWKRVKTPSGEGSYSSSYSTTGGSVAAGSFEAALLPPNSSDFDPKDAFLRGAADGRLGGAASALGIDDDESDTDCTDDEGSDTDSDSDSDLTSESDSSGSDSDSEEDSLDPDAYSSHEDYEEAKGEAARYVLMQSVEAIADALPSKARYAIAEGRPVRLPVDARGAIDVEELVRRKKERVARKKLAKRAMERQWAPRRDATELAGEGGGYGKDASASSSSGQASTAARTSRRRSELGGIDLASPRPMHECFGTGSASMPFIVVDALGAMSAHAKLGLDPDIKAHIEGLREVWSRSATLRGSSLNMQPGTVGVVEPGRDMTVNYHIARREEDALVPMGGGEGMGAARVPGGDHLLSEVANMLATAPDFAKDVAVMSEWAADLLDGEDDEGGSKKSGSDSQPPLDEDLAVLSSMLPPSMRNEVQAIVRASHKLATAASKLGFELTGDMGRDSAVLARLLMEKSGSEDAPDIPYLGGGRSGARVPAGSDAESDGEWRGSDDVGTGATTGGSQLRSPVPPARWRRGRAAHARDSGLGPVDLSGEGVGQEDDEDWLLDRSIGLGVSDAAADTADTSDAYQGDGAGTGEDSVADEAVGDASQTDDADEFDGSVSYESVLGLAGALPTTSSSSSGSPVDGASGHAPIVLDGASPSDVFAEDCYPRIRERYRSKRDLHRSQKSKGGSLADVLHARRSRLDRVVGTSTGEGLQATGESGRDGPTRALAAHAAGEIPLLCGGPLRTSPFSLHTDSRLGGDAVLSLPVVLRQGAVAQGKGRQHGAKQDARASAKQQDADDAEEEVDVSVLQVLSNAKPSQLQRAAVRAAAGQARTAPSGAAELEDVVGFESLSGWAPGYLERELREGSWVVVEHENPWALVLEAAGRGHSAPYFGSRPDQEAKGKGKGKGAAGDEVAGPSAGGSSTWRRVMLSLGGQYAGFAEIPTLEAEVQGLEVEWENGGEGAEASGRAGGLWGDAKEDECDPGAASIRGGAGRLVPRLRRGDAALGPDGSGSDGGETPGRQ